MNKSNLTFPSNDIYSMLVKGGFSYTLLVESTSVNNELTQQHTIKSLNYNNELIDLNSFQKNDLTIQTSNTLKVAGKFTNEAFILPDQLINLPIYWYANFVLNNTLRILGFSCNVKAPLSSFINLIRKNIILIFENTKLKRKIYTQNNEIKKIQLVASGQPNDSESGKEENNLHTHLLLAEDNPANQILITQQLERLGYLVDVAEDGVKAYNKWATGKYNLLLTDCNMPIMDGFELTDAIRETEKRKGGHIPIIALTANAIQGEDKKCIARGMDDYLSKPIKLNALKDLLNRWVPSEKMKSKGEINNQKISNEKQNLTTSSDEKIIIDFASQTDFLSDDLEIKNEFLQIFLRSLPTIISEISPASNSQIIEPIEFNLHKMKSSVKTIGAEKYLATVIHMESLVELPDWPALKPSTLKIKSSINEIEKYIKAHFNESDKHVNNQQNEHVYSIPSNVNVLVIDDDLFILEYVKALLNKLNVNNIQTADHGAVALEILDDNKNSIDMILCDLNMPKMDGVTLLGHLSDIGYSGGIIIHSGAETSMLNAVSNLASEHRLNLLGSVQKPISTSSVLSLFEKMYLSETQNKNNLAAPCNKPVEISASALRNAIECNHIVAYYQPKINMHDKSVIGFEALARWVDPVNGIISPGLFIPLAESEGLIADLTTTIFNQATTQLQQWLQKNPKLQMAINFSIQSLDDFDLPETLSDQVQTLNISSNNIIIEVTESGLIEDMAASMEVLARLKRLGFSLSIDDFGTGYSSMNQLQTLPFSELKLDYSFVHGAARNIKSKAIFESSINLAKNLQLSTVAEGVETQEDWDLVKELDCDTVQGFFISKPMDANTANQWLNDWKF